MKQTITIEGMHCNSCKVLIEDIASDINGIKSCKVDVKSGKMIVEHEVADLKQLKKEIEAAGEYKVKL